MDPANLDLLTDFAEDRSTTRILEIECQFTDDYLIGHAMRVGLAGDQTSQETLDRLLPTIRGDMVHESDRIREAGFEHLTLLRETVESEVNAEALGGFLSIPADKARQIVGDGGLFAD